MFDSRITPKNRYLAAFLAFMLPGAGHFYQGRTFKAVVYLVCILGTYSYGLAMAGGHGVYTHKINTHSNSRARNFPFLAQTGVGLFGAVGWYQSQRYFGQGSFRDNSFPVAEGIDTPTTGEISFADGSQDIVQKVEGQLHFGPADNKGTLTVSVDGQEETIQLSNPTSHAPQLAGAETWTVYCDIQEVVNNIPRTVGQFEGEIPRSFMNWFCVPPNTATVDRWYNRYGGKKYDLAVVLTMIAGLLNFLVVWDAFEGPAHGYGDESSLTDKKKKTMKEPSKADPAPQEETSAPSTA